VGYSQVSQGEEPTFKRNKPVVLVWDQDEDGEYLKRVSTQDEEEIQWEEADAPAPTKKNTPTMQAPPKKKGGVKANAAEAQRREVPPTERHRTLPFAAFQP
jgi:hypothetical protein